VEAYCAVPPDDPFAVSRDMFDVLAAELAGPAARSVGMSARGPGVGQATLPISRSGLMRMTAFAASAG
jgi:hypothetical protein